MSGPDLDAIRARVDAATEGPWQTSGGWELGSTVLDSNGHELIDSRVGSVPCPRTEEDAEFIAHAREDIPALLAEVERLRAARDEQGRYLSVAADFASTNVYTLEDAMNALLPATRTEAALARVRGVADRWEQIGRDGGANHRLAAAWLRTALAEETK